MAIERTAAQKLQEVSALLAVPNSRITAGGTTFPQDPEEELHLVDISALEGLDSIKQKGSRIEIGPLVTLKTLAENKLIQTIVPALAEAAANAGTEEIRGSGTLGGNLAHPHPGDTAAALLASGAKLTIKTDSDYRELLIDRFWDKDGKNDLEYDEWITRITVQIPKGPFSGAAFSKYGRWEQPAEPNIAAAVQLTLDANNKITSIRGGLRLGSALIQRMFPLEKALKNQTPTEESISKAVRAMVPTAQNYIDADIITQSLTHIINRAADMAQERRAL